MHIKKIILILFLYVIIYSQINAAVFTNIKIRNISDNNTNNVIQWTNLSVQSNSWIVANQYIEVNYLTNHSIITGWGIQIYTHNTTNIANPMYKGSTDPSGLIETVFSNFAVPMAWLIQTNKIKPVKPKERGDLTGFTNYDWHYMSDKKSAGFTNEKDYFIPWNQGGIAWHESVRQMKPLKAYIFFAANFQNLFITKYENIYQTTQLRVEEYRNPNALFLQSFFIYTNAWLSEPVPNHYTPEYENWGAGGTQFADYNYTTDYHSPGSCIRLYFGPNSQGAYVWFEPYPWAPLGKKYGYDLTGTSKLTFWVKGSNTYNNLIYAQIGGTGDSCGTIQNVDNGGDNLFNVTTSWVQHYIPITTQNMRDVTRGFSIGTWNGAANTRVIYVDDIRYEK